MRLFGAAVSIAIVIPFGSHPELRAQGAATANREVAPETAAVARGWEMLAKGDAAAASTLAGDLLKKYPASAAVLVLAIDAAAAQSGALAALGVYERWLGSRTLEDGYVLRRVARALLREIARNHADRARSLEAIEALIRDGNADAASLLPSKESTGNQQTVDSLIAESKEPGPGRRMAILALAKSGSSQAITPLTALLKDPDPVVRAATAEALGALSAEQAIPSLKSLLDDPVFHVRVAAATALATLKDPSGIGWLRPLLASEHAGVRVGAAAALKNEADADWLFVVRGLTKETDPEIRRQAAELVAPHDPELARATLEPLLNDPNPALRQAAADSYATATADFAVLRRFLRSADAGTQVRAADRMLSLTR